MSINLLNTRIDVSGKAFIEFLNPEDAKKAVEALSKSGVSIDGSHIEVSMARPKGHPDSKTGRIGRTLYVGNLDFNIEDW